jgi:hypothetical protein
MDVTLPNGKVIKGVPDSTPKEVIMQKAIDSGLAVASDFPVEQPQTQIQPEEDVGFIDKLSTMVSGSDRTTPEIEALPTIGNAPEFSEMSSEAFKANLGTFTTGDLSEQAKIIKQQYGDRVNFRQDEKGNYIADFPSGSYALNKPGLSLQDIPKFMGDVLAFSPAGRATTIPSAIGRSATGEALLEGGDVALGGDFDAGEVATSAALGGVFKGAEDLLGAAWRALRGKSPDEAAALLKSAEDSGIPIMTSDVMPPQTFPGKVAQQTGEKIPLAGTAGAREGQQEFRVQAVDEIAQKYNSFSYKSIIDSLKSKKDRVKLAAGNVLESAGNKLDDAGVIPTDNTAKRINSVREELSKPGVMTQSSALDDLAEISNAVGSAPQTYSTLKENRTAFREVVDGLDPTARSQLSTRAKSLLKSVEHAMTADMKAFAKNNLTPQEFMKLNKANAVYAEEAKKLTKTKLKNILDKGDFTPENVKQLLFSKNQSDMKLLYDGLTQTGRANSRAAIINKIVSDLSSRQSGLTPNSFASQLKKYDPQIKVFFKGKERKQLEGLRRALEATRRAQDAAVTTPTGQSLAGGLTAYSAFTDLGATLGIGGTAGGLARLYESAPVRNALLKLSGAPKGSTAFEQALREVNESLLVAAQAMRSELQDREELQE